MPTKSIKTLKNRANYDGYMMLSKKRRKPINVLQDALLEFRTMRAENFQKQRDQKLDDLYNIKNKWGYKVVCEQGRTVGSEISRTERAIRTNNANNLLPTAIETLKER